MPLKSHWSPRSIMFRTVARVLAAALPLLPLAAYAASEARVAVLPVVVHSLDEQEYLRDGIADMLSTRLAQSPQVTVIRIEDAEQATVDLEAARASAREAGADWVVYGSFTRFGEGASLDLRAASAAEDGVAAERTIFTQSGTLSGIIPQLDDVSSKIVQYVTTHDPAMPAVSAGPGEAATAAPANSELQSLRERIERLEQVIYGRDTGGREAEDQAEPGVR